LSAVVHAARVGIIVLVGWVATSCVNLSYPPGATRNGDGGVPAHLGNGRACTGVGDCQSGFCVDGVCCQKAACDTCFTCALPGNEGFCLPAPVGTNPRNLCVDQQPKSCGTNGQCDGQGACAKYPTGTVCEDASCVVHQVMLASRCNAAGVCVPGLVQPCSPYLCDDVGSKCLTSCAALMALDCENGHPCDTMTLTCGKKALGTACGDQTECDSNFCSQGVCCAVDCAGGCLSCALKGSEGACLPVMAGAKPPDPTSCLASDPSTCGLDGTCDGAGACRSYLPGTACGATTCTSATLRGGGTCDGKTNCQVSTTTATCGGYICASPTACKTTCATDTDCASPSVCGLPQMACGGLLAQYYRQTNLTDLAFSRTDATINYNWGLGSPSPLLNVDNFSIRWHGKLTARFSEPYTFYASTDDGERLIIAGQTVIDHFIRHSTIPEDVTQTPIMLTAGKPVDIEFDYFESGGDSSYVLSWSSMSEPKAVIPTSALAPQ
jgi:hypothetical protein